MTVSETPLPWNRIVCCWTTGFNM